MMQVTPEPESAEGADLHLRLTRLIGLRLCHDLGGLAGTIGNALEMLNDAGAEAADLAGEAADMLRRRLLLWRAVLGSGEARTLGVALGLLKGQIAGGRAHLEIGDMPEGAPLSEALVPLLLSGLLLAGEALPRGGLVRLAGDLQREITILPIGIGATWNPVLLRHVAGAPLPSEISSRDALALWLWVSAAAAGVSVSLALSPNDAAPILIMTLPG
ncbi:MAG: histidine phosphotransferase family protein [Alphaproteobacteria bacterium]|jgi:histidine phosphotransferase ChpT